MSEVPHQPREMGPDLLDSLCPQLPQEVSVHLIVMKGINLVPTAEAQLHHLVMMMQTHYNLCLSAPLAAQFQEA